MPENYTQIVELLQHSFGLIEDHLTFAYLLQIKGHAGAHIAGLGSRATVICLNRVTTQQAQQEEDREQPEAPFVAL